MSNTKPQVILDLEQEFGFELKEVVLKNVWNKSKSFSKNENRDITGLNFGSEVISNINSLANLKELKILSLFKVQVSDVSPLKDLENLQILFLHNTQVSDLSPLKDLNNLQTLLLNETQVSDVSPLKDLKNLQVLFLRRTQVSDVSPLKDLKNLQTLELSSTQVTNLSPLKDLKNLQTLELSRTKVTKLLPLKDLKNLQRLDLSSTQVSNVLPLKDLKNLQTIYLRYTQVSDLSPLENLKNLQTLHLNSTQVNDVLPLKNLKNLQTLHLSSTQVSDVSPLKDLKNLQELYLKYMKVSDLSPLKDLKNLQELYLSSAQVCDLSPLKDLKNLQRLGLSSTQVSDVSPLKDLKNLQTLLLNETQVSDVSPLKDLKNLQTLELSSTQVNDLSPLQELPKLIILDVQKCVIKTISLKIAEKFKFPGWEKTEFAFKAGIYLYGNPIEDFLPPEIINKGQKAVIAYLESKGITKAIIKENKFQRNITFKPNFAPLNEVKTLIIGGGGCGKTSLMRRLMGQDFNPKEDQTHGIRILKHQIEYKDKENTKIDVHFWDFGGQEINHATHQFFYSKRSLYVLVLDARQEQQAEYWLKYIESFGGSSPVLVVLNKIDENPAFEVNRRFLLEKYPNIKDSGNFYRVSCSTDEGIEELREAVHKALYNLDLRKMELAPSWFAVKEALTNMKENYISYDKYFEICHECRVTDATAQEVLRDLIHDLGLALDFKRLRDFNRQVLNPKWITNGVYRIINSPKVGGEGKGVLRFDTLNDILHDWERYDAEDDKNYKYPNHTHRYITGIMQEFQLCYELDESAYIVPDLLPVQEPAGLDYVAHPLHFVIRYEDLLPRSVMPRFMVQMHHRIPEGIDKRWRTGVVIHEPLYEASAIIRADYAEKEIHIWVKGKDRRRMLSFIRKTFEGIRASFTKLNVSEWYVIQKEKGKKAVLVDYETLVICDKENNGVYFCPELRKNFNTKDLLNGIETPGSRTKTNKIRAFISYSHKDEKLKDEFKAHLKPLTYEYDLELWDDREIDAGKQWEDEIISHLERDELIFLLISSDSIASNYIWQKEIPKALKRHNSGRAIVVPVILRPCVWEVLDFWNIQAVPKNAKPITKWKNQDSAWLDAVRQIETVLKSERLEGLRKLR